MTLVTLIFEMSCRNSCRQSLPMILLCFMGTGNCLVHAYIQTYQTTCRNCYNSWKNGYRNRFSADCKQSMWTFEGFWSFRSRLTPRRSTSSRGKSRASAVIECWCVDFTLVRLLSPSNRQIQSTRYVFISHGCFLCHECQHISRQKLQNEFCLSVHL